MEATKIVAGGSTGGLGGVLLVYLGQRLGWHLTPTDGGSIVAGSTVVLAFIAHNGVVGIARLLWHGSQSTPAPALPATIEPPVV